MATVMFWDDKENAQFRAVIFFNFLVMNNLVGLAIVIALLAAVAILAYQAWHRRQLDDKYFELNRRDQERRERENKD